MKTLLLFLLKIYRYAFSFWLGRSCRFFPSCSHYSTEAIEKYGASKGFWLTCCRLSRCHPWHSGGYDPVP